MKQWKRYKSYILPYKSAFILGPLMMVTEVLGEILLPKFMSMIINHGVAQKDGGYILKMGLVMAITACDLDYTPNTAVKTTVEAAMSTSLGFGGHNACVAFRKMRG